LSKDNLIFDNAINNNESFANNNEILLSSNNNHIQPSDTITKCDNKPAEGSISNELNLNYQLA
jgi:hypothetical protein